MIILPYQRPLLILLLALILSLTIHGIFILGCFIMYLDMMARYKDYLRIKDTKFTVAMTYRLGHSWCGRGVCLYVWPKEAKQLYDALGYRWYHIFPDGFPLVFTKLSFWKSVVGYKK